MSEIETLMMNRGACVTEEGELPNWAQRLLSLVKRLEGAQWHTCAGIISIFSRIIAGMSQMFYQGKENHLCVCSLCMFVMLYSEKKKRKNGTMNVRCLIHTNIH